MNKLVVLHDSPDYGGHEAMFLRFLPNLIDSGAFDRIVIRFPQGNIQFEQRLDAIASPTLDARPWPFAKKRAEPYLAPFRRHYARAVRGLIAAEKPSSLLLLQGRIENLAVPLLAAPPDTFIVSYVPMAHSMAQIGRASVPGDIARRRLYRRPNRFIVPSAAVATQVRLAGGGEAVVVDNVVSPPPRGDRMALRAALGLPARRKIALFLGRLDIRQKGVDQLAAAIRRDAADMAGWTILFVGDGEGRTMIGDLAMDCSDRIDIGCIGWTDRPHEYLAASDLLLMPSRWEGVPLAMLEAISYGIPILGSDIDVFREYLPASCRVDFGRVALADAMNRAIDPAMAPQPRPCGNGVASSARFLAALRA